VHGLAPGAELGHDGRALREVCQQRAGPQLAVSLGPGVAGDPVGGAREDSPGDPAGELQFVGGTGTGHVHPALQVQGEVGVGPGAGRPGLVVDAQHPGGVEVQTGRLQEAQNLDRRFRPPGLEDRLTAERGQGPQGLHEGHGGAHQVQAAQLRQDLPEAQSGLGILAIDRAFAGPSAGLQQGVEGLRPACGGLPDGKVPAQGQHPVQVVGQDRTGIGAGQAFTIARTGHPGQPLQSRMGDHPPAQPRVQQASLAAFRFSTAQVGRREQGPDLLEGQGSMDQVQQGQRVDDQAPVGQGAAQREVVGAGATGLPRQDRLGTEKILQKALQQGSAAPQVGHHQGDPGLRVLGQKPPGPAHRRGGFGLGVWPVGPGEVSRLARVLPDFCFATRSIQGLQEGFVAGGDPVEAHQEEAGRQRHPPRIDGFFEGLQQSGGVQPSPSLAQVADLAGPPRKGLGIVV